MEEKLPDNSVKLESQRQETGAPQGRKRSNALPGGEELFRLMVESAKDYSIFAADTEGRIVSWNTGAERVFGYTEAEAIGQNVSIFFTPEDVAGACWNTNSFKLLPREKRKMNVGMCARTAHVSG